MNLSFWIAVLYLSFRMLRLYVLRRPSLTVAAHSGGDGVPNILPAMEGMLIYCSGSILILLLIPNLSPRFGATFVPLFALVLILFLHTTNSMLLRTLAYVLLIVPPVINVTGRIRRFSDDLSSAHMQWAMAANYVKEISTASASSIYVVDDISGGFSSTESIRRFAGYHGKLVRVNDLISGEHCTADPKVDIQKISSNHVKVASELDSPCGGHAFLSSRMNYPIGGDDLSRSIKGARLVYHGVPAATVRFLSATGKLSVDITNAEPSSVLLFPDLRMKVYRDVSFGQ
jgi:hypothetical protein